MQPSINHYKVLFADCFFNKHLITCSKSLVFILFLFFYSNIAVTQNHSEKVIVNSHLKDIDSIILVSDSSIIAKIGNDNFDLWLDSIVVVDIPYDNGCQGVTRPCDPIPPRVSDNDRIRMTYFFTIPVYGKYSNSNYAYRDKDSAMVFEDHFIMPDCNKDPYKCAFISRDTLFNSVKDILLIKDTSQLISSVSYYYSGNFSHLFKAGKSSIILSSNTGKVLKYTYYGPFSSNDCRKVQKCILNDLWVENAKGFLRINDDFKLISESPSQTDGRSCVWKFSSDRSYLELNGKDGLVLTYLNYKDSIEN